MASRPGGAVAGLEEYALTPMASEHGAHDFAHVMVVVDDQDLDRRNAPLQMLGRLIHGADKIRVIGISKVHQSITAISDG